MTFTKCATFWCRAITEAGLYRGFSRSELEREYSPSSCIGGDTAPLIEIYEAQSTAARRACPVHEDLAYGATPEQVLDLFLPEVSAHAPLHVFLHGGYWQELSHKQSAVMAEGLTACGIAHAVVNYTLAPLASISDMVEECRQALFWLKAHAHGYGIDPAAISLSGHSAGAHLAAMLLSGDAPVTGLTGALLISGIYELEPLRHTSIDGPLGLTHEQCIALSPLLLNQGIDHPVRLIAGAIETAEFHRQTAAFAGHLQAQNVAADVQILDGLNHFDIICAPRVIDAICAFH